MADDITPYCGPIVTRAEAKAAGLRQYFTGIPCGNGHNTPRQVSNYACLVCNKLRLKALAANNPAATFERYRTYRVANADKRKQQFAVWYKANADKQHEYMRKKRAQNPDVARTKDRTWRLANLENVKASQAKSRSKNIEKIRTTRVRWFNNNREKIRQRRIATRQASSETARAWRKANPEKSRVILRCRRARLRGSSGTHTAADIIALAAQQRHRCAHSWCRASFAKTGYHVDHVLPLILGGSNGRRNLQLLCPPCNLRKNAKHPIDFAQQNGLLL